MSAEYLVVPQLAGAREALRVLGDVNGWLVTVGVALEAASLDGPAAGTGLSLRIGAAKDRTSTLDELDGLAARAAAHARPLEPPPQERR